MPDSFPPMPSATARHGDQQSERRSRPSNGLPIFSTEPLTAAEDVMLGELARTHRLVAQRIDEARQTGTVARGIEVTAVAAELGPVAGRIGATLGSRR